jgi:hypothetical protein
MVGGRGSRPVLIGLAAAGVVAASGCGNEPTEAERVESVVLDMQDAYAEGDFRRLCESVTRKAWEEVGRTAHEYPWVCRRDLARAGGYIERTRAAGYSRMPAVEVGDVDGDRATVIADFGHGPARKVEFVKRAGSWKLNNFFGVTTGGAPLATAPPLRPGSHVDVSRTDGVRCGGVRPAGPMLRGYPTTLRLNDLGRIWIDELKTSGAIACNDVELCRANFVHRPWVGQIDDDMRARINVCLATCIGEFRDQLVLDLERERSRWRLVARDEVVGPGGWEIDGKWRLSAATLSVRPS